LYYIGNGHDATIWILSRTCTADSLNPAEDPNDEQNYWTQAQLQNEPNFQSFESGCGTAISPACAVAGDYLYFVWIQLEGTSSHNLRVFATRLEPASGGSSMAWSPPVRLCGNGGSPLHITESNFAVTAWGRYLIGCYSSTGQTYLLVYDTSPHPCR
jgi:hypothetical protein